MTTVCHEVSWYWCNFLLDTQAEGFAYAAIATLVFYDWSIFLGQEADLIWRRQWTFSKFMYIALRTLGMIYGLANVFYYAPWHITDSSCVAFSWIIPLSEALGFTVIQFVMIVRLYAMSGRSKALLAMLLLGYTIAQGILYANTIRNAIRLGNSAADLTPLGYPGVCLAMYHVYIVPLLRGQYVSLLTLEVLMLGVSLYFFRKHLKHSRGHRGTWSTTNVFVLLVRDNILYFVLTAAIFLSESLSELPTNWGPEKHIAFDVFNAVFSGIVVGVVGPHLILSILHHHAISIRGGPSIGLTDMSTMHFTTPRESTHGPVAVKSRGDVVSDVWV
ncbi:hypothetical protein CONPUDRAFT_170387 [Coniophora puteana RWD-64-598 SS2]|uniref:DUF6533 domain-containing protein n=1 Tax=Coniophora puteana (strain RWD-64-598) TaxID=741705 RepID=R7SCW1_CONPW|nr:uncharacterized protein CONPUDRAFT_170387 [Coniophora puteana RWD-64-598 SS2]EIW74011.1 hypothetical protein CONPUDRAFT_170387 [Coniophora puteana RWD-64-598 SS2]